jgi:hypothetical protein
VRLDRALVLALILKDMDLAARNLAALERALVGMESEHVACRERRPCRPRAVRWASLAQSAAPDFRRREKGRLCGDVIGRVGMLIAAKAGLLERALFVFELAWCFASTPREMFTRCLFRLGLFTAGMGS